MEDDSELFNQIHTDAEFARQGVFGQRVAHGLLGLAVATGLAAHLGFIEGTVLAFRELTWKFSLPIFFGDTIHVKASVANLKPMRRLGGGAVTFDVQVINQQDKVVQRIADHRQKVPRSPQARSGNGGAGEGPTGETGETGDETLGARVDLRL